MKGIGIAGIITALASMGGARHQPIALPNRRRRKRAAGGRGWTRALRLAFREQMRERYGLDVPELAGRADISAELFDIKAHQRRLRNARKRERQEARR